MKKMKIFSIVASVLMIGAITVGLVFGLTNGKKNVVSSIVLTTPTQTYKLSMQDVKELEKKAYDEITNNQLNLLDDGETPPEETPPPSVTDSVKQLTAKWIQDAFFNASLTGDYKYDYYAATPIAPTLSSILRPDLSVDVNDNWVASNIDSPSILFKNGVETKFYLDTTGSSKNANIYITELASQDNEIGVACGMFQIPGIDNIYDMKNQSQNDYNSCLEQISKNIDYQLAILNFLYAYTYFWQKSTGAYDYYLTQLLQEQKMAFIWSMSVDSIGQDIPNPKFYNYLLDQPISEIQSGGTTSDWFDLMGQDNFPGLLIQKDTLTGENTTWDIGYKGLLTKASAGITIDPQNDLFKVSNAYNFNSNPDGTGVDFTTIGKYGLNTLAAPEVYESAQGDAIILKPGDEGGIASQGDISAATLVYPFTFAEKYNPGNNNAENFSFALFGKQRPGGQAGEYVKAVVGETGALSIFDIITNATNAIPGYPLSADYIQLYIINSLYNNIKENATSTSQKFWNDRGFYITLTGSFEDDYGPLIPKGLQKPE